ncbi:hypothetical protein N7539_006072 [Penicillium diatomitis]|uniref:Uncharacterized protein n=1 Tax=Penicillium diatomitis TaxID=2819901 RepID=A0A9W9X4U2_9EURO|nr:uncharacterized protein N7539_006072 [Penicillium diatomitis]KAJ5483872.1 hypothetical protein N7539_006072 [Penicillium diatomitis]
MNVISAVIRIVKYMKKHSKKRLTADAQGFLSDTTLNTLPPGNLYSPSRLTLITLPEHAVSELNREIRRQSASDREKIAETREPRRDGT